jgi:hypothetical protein
MLRPWKAGSRRPGSLARIACLAYLLVSMAHRRYDFYREANFTMKLAIKVVVVISNEKLCHYNHNNCGKDVRNKLAAYSLLTAAFSRCLKRSVALSLVGEVDVTHP